MNIETFLSKKAYEMVEGLMKQAANRNPDAFDMYIYNGLYSMDILISRPLFFNVQPSSVQTSMDMLFSIWLTRR